MYRRLLALILFISAASLAQAQVCNPDPSFTNAGPGVYPFSVATPDCSDTLATKTIVSITDTTISFTQPIVLDVTIYYDSSRVASVSGLPSGLSFGTDVDDETSAFLPYGAWVNGGTIPNVTPAVGCVYVHGDTTAWQNALAGGDTGVYYIEVEYDARIVQTDPDVSAFGVPNGTWLSQVDPSFGGGTITIQVPLDTEPITDLSIPTITGNASAHVAIVESYTAPVGLASYNWAVVGGTIQSGQGTNQIVVLFDGGIESGLVTVEVGDGEGCTKSRNYEVAIAGVGIDETGVITANIYPNPSSDVFNIQLENSETTFLRVLDLTGKTLKEERLSGSTIYMLDMKNMPIGIYLLELESEKGKGYKRLVKQ